MNKENEKNRKITFIKDCLEVHNNIGFSLSSVLYFCLLLPLLLAVVQGAESLAGWKLNFSVPR